MKALALADCTEALCLSAAFRVRILEKSRCTTSRIWCKQSAHKLIACHLFSYVIFACPWRTKNVSAAACGDPLWRTLAKNDVEMPGNTDRDNHNFVGLLVALACYQQPFCPSNLTLSCCRMGIFLLPLYTIGSASHRRNSERVYPSSGMLVFDTLYVV
jgi:hypothetical protein